jgi:hypothetical protein
MKDFYATMQKHITAIEVPAPETKGQNLLASGEREVNKTRLLPYINSPLPSLRCIVLNN